MVKMSPDICKALAAERALELVEPGMKIGLGTGSTSAKFVEQLGRKVQEGLDVICVPTSEETRLLAERFNIRLSTLDDLISLDLTVDGADEVDGQLNLIKGGGGALLREKIVAMASERMVVIADHSKLVPQLGRYPLPAEIVRFGAMATLQMVREAANDAECFGDIELRRLNGEHFVTDNGNYIADCKFGEIPEPETLSAVLEMLPGVVEHGLFIGIADLAIIAGPDGVDVLEADEDDD